MATTTNPRAERGARAPLPLIDRPAFRAICLEIIRDPRADGYAQAYADAGIALAADNGAGAEDRRLRIQALYIVGNLSRWRAPRAAAIRRALRAIGNGEE